MSLTNDQEHEASTTATGAASCSRTTNAGPPRHRASAHPTPPNRSSQTPLVLGLAWTYAALRVAHSVIHTTRNDVDWRFRTFILSWIVLLALWVVLVFG